MKKMRKCWSFFLVLVMSLNMMIPAYAEDISASDGQEETCTEILQEADTSSEEEAELPAQEDTDTDLPAQEDTETDPSEPEDTETALQEQEDTGTDIPVQEDTETDLPAQEDSAPEEETRPEAAASEETIPDTSVLENDEKTEEIENLIPSDAAPETLPVANEPQAVTASGTCGVDGDNLTWTYDDSGVLTISGSGEMASYADSADNRAPWFSKRTSIKTLVIGDGVTKIGNYAFAYLEKLTSIDFGSTVTTIGNYAFRSCNALSSIDLPEGVTTLNPFAFGYCLEATAVSIPASLTTIGTNAFYSCEKLTSYSVAAGNTAYSAVDGVLFDKDQRKLLWYPAANSRTSYVIPESVRIIEANAFIFARNLSSVSFSQVNTLNVGAFYGCSGLTALNLPDTLNTLSAEAFACCYGLTELTLPNLLPTIGAKAFRDCDHLESVVFGASVANINASAFLNCSTLTEMTFKGNAPTINSTAFTGVTATAYYPPNNITWTEEKLQDYGGTITWVAPTLSYEVTIAGRQIDENNLSGLINNTLSYTYEPMTKILHLQGIYTAGTDDLGYVIWNTGVDGLTIQLDSNVSFYAADGKEIDFIRLSKDTTITSKPGSDYELAIWGNDATALNTGIYVASGAKLTLRNTDVFAGRGLTYGLSGSSLGGTTSMLYVDNATVRLITQDYSSYKAAGIFCFGGGIELNEETCCFVRPFEPVIMNGIVYDIAGSKYATWVDIGTDDPYPLAVAGIRVTAGNKDNILSGITAVATFNPDTNTLFINDGFSSTDNAPLINNYIDGLTIQVTETAMLSLESASTAITSVILSHGNLSITGEKLTLNGGGAYNRAGVQMVGAHTLSVHDVELNVWNTGYGLRGDLNGESTRLFIVSAEVDLDCFTSGIYSFTGGLFLSESNFILPAYPVRTEDGAIRIHTWDSSSDYYNLVPHVQLSTSVYGLVIDGVRVHEGNLDSLPGGFSFDPSTNTLTAPSSYTQQTASPNTYRKRPVIDNLIDGLKIRLTGDTTLLSSLENYNSYVPVINSSGELIIYADNSLATPKLTLGSTSDSITFDGIHILGHLTLQNIDLQISRAGKGLVGDGSTDSQLWFKGSKSTVMANGGASDAAGATGFNGGIFLTDGSAFSSTDTTIEDGSIKENNEVAKNFIIVCSGYDLWVGGVQVTRLNKDDIPAFTEGKASFDPDTNTLTLDNVGGVKGVHTTPDGYASVIHNELSEELYIQGSGTIDPRAAGFRNCYGIYGQKVILGTDLDLTIGSDTIYGIRCKLLTLKGGKLTILYANNASIRANRIYISGGELDADAGTYGIIVDDGEMIISGGRVNVTAYVDDGSDSYEYNGIACVGSNLIIKGEDTFVHAVGEKQAFGFYGTTGGLTVSSPLKVLYPDDGQISGNKILDSQGNDAAEVIIGPEGAYPAYPLWVGSTQVTSGNKDDILGDGSASYDPASATLTITKVPAITGVYNGTVIYANGIDLTINASAGLTLSSEGIDAIYDNGSLVVNGNITIRGDGTNGLRAENITINGDVDIEAEESALYTFNGNIAVNGNVKAVATSDSAEKVSLAIFATGGISIDGDVTASANGIAMFARSGGIQMLSGVWTLEGGTYAILSGSEKEIAIAAGYGITVPEGGRLAKISGAEEMLWTVTEADGVTAAKKVVIEPYTVYNLWVEGTLVADWNKDDILGDGGISFDPSTNTLSVNGTYTYTEGAFIRAIIDITLTGTAQLTGGSAYPVIYLYSNTLTLDRNADLTVSGTDLAAFEARKLIVDGGSLTVKNESNCAILCDDLLLNSGSISATSSCTAIRYISTMATSTITVNGGSLYAKTTWGTSTYPYSAIDVSQVNFNGGRLEAISSYSESQAIRATVTLGEGCVYTLDEQTHKILERAELWVRGELVTSLNQDDILGDGAASYDPSTKTLTINGTYTYTENAFIKAIVDITLTGTAQLTGGHDYPVIYLFKNTLTLDSDADLTVSGTDLAAIEVKGLTVNGGSLTVKNGSNCAILCDNLLLNSGSISATSSCTAIRYISTMATSIITVNGGSLYAKTTWGNSSYPYSAIDVSQVNFNGGRLEAISSYSESQAIRATVTLGEGCVYTLDEQTHKILERAELYGLWVGSTQVTSNNKDDILGDGTASYDPDAKALTFTTDTPAISGEHAVTIVGSGATWDITYLIYSKDDLTINAPNGLTLTSGSDFAVSSDNGALTVNGAIMINSLVGTGLDAWNDITVNGSVSGSYNDFALWSDMGSILVTGDVDVTSDYTGSGAVIFAEENIEIQGSATVKATASPDYGIYASFGKVTMTSGIWDITAAETAVYAKAGIIIPATYVIASPENGRISQVIVDSTTYYTITESDGTIAAHVVIEPKLRMTITHSCSFGNNLSINYYVPASTVEGYENVRLVVKKQVFNADGTSYTWKEYTVSDYTNITNGGVAYKRFVFNNVAAKEMGDELRAIVYADKDGVTYESNVDAYSVKTYAYNRLEKSKDDVFKTLLVDMLNYGAAAQVYFGYNTSHPANAELTDVQRALGTAEVPELVSIDNTIKQEGATAHFKGRSIVMGSNVELKYYMTFDAGEPTENTKLVITYTTISGTNSSTTIPASQFIYDTDKASYTGKVTTIAAKDMSCLITAKIYDGDVMIGDISEYSVESYVYNRLLKSTDENFKALIRELIKYGKSAEAYFRSQQTS